LRFVHASDLHVDSPLLGLARYPGAPVDLLRQATRRALSNLVRLCEEEDVQLLLLAGDLFDGEWRDYNTGLFFAAEMARLKRAGVRVITIRGNHDAMSQISKHLTLPDNVIELSHRSPETRILAELGLAVHGQSYAHRVQTEDLSQHYPDPVSGYLNIGLLHTSVNGRPGHEDYAPCRLESLIAKGYDYWALGHVHQREVLHERPWVVFSGNLQGRHMRELGPKGATLVTYDAGQISSVESRILDVARWEICEVTLSSETDTEQALDTVTRCLEEQIERAGQRPMIVRVVLLGHTALHATFTRDPEQWEASVRARASELENIWIESVRIETSGTLDAQALGARGDALGQLARRLTTLKQDPAALGALGRQFDELRQKLPNEIRQGATGLRLEDPAELSLLLAEVEQLLLSQLLASGELE
jgi:DNA repair exonuclease SbcCD nuclease subunit